MSEKNRYSTRRNRLRQAMIAQGLTALLVTQAANRFYLSGFELHDPQPGESAGCLFITAQGQDWLLTDARYLIGARRLWPGEHIFIYGQSGASIKDFLLSQKLSGPLGVEAKAMSLDLFNRLSQARDGAPELQLTPTSGLVEKLRLIKDAGEVKALRAACALNQAMFRELPAWLDQPMTEKALAWKIEKFFRENGAEELAFASIVAYGPNAALPHAIPGQDQVQPEGPVLVDVGCRVQDYCSDQTRTLWSGKKPTSEFTSTLARVREAQDQALAFIKPGQAIAEAYNTAKAAFARHGVEAHFTHSLGHGIGLETHEAPSLSPRSQDMFLPGMVVTVEPGLYYPQWGGVRWEYMVLVTDQGIEVL